MTLVERVRADYDGNGLDDWRPSSTWPAHAPVVPMGPVRQYTGQVVEGPLTLTIYPGADGSFVVYEDDGQTFDCQRGAWMGIALQWRDAERRVTISLASGSRRIAGRSRCACRALRVQSGPGDRGEPGADPSVRF